MGEDLVRVSPQEAAEEYLAHRRLELAESSIGSYARRLRPFVQWCKEQGIESLADLTTRDLKRYMLWLKSQDVSPSTVRNRAMTLYGMLDYCEGHLAPPDIADDVDIPTLSKSEQTSDTKLADDQAAALLKYYRENHFGSRSHALITILWHVGCRRGALRSLDLEHYHSADAYLEFEHRPDTGLPLKNAEESERAVKLAEWACAVLDEYINRHRNDVRDANGLDPLVTSQRGRPGVETLTQWTYDATLPCVHSACPHGNDPADCQWARHNHTSKCPSSRSPHQLRTGAITYMLDQGIPVEVVAKRVDAKPETIRRFYDKATTLAEMDRRKHYFSDMEEP